MDLDQYKQAVETRLATRLVVDPQTGCWNCLGGPSGKPAMLSIRLPGRGRRAAKAARVAAWLWLGAELDGPHTVNHTCNNNLCCNPHEGHIYVGDQSQNVQDMVKSGTFHHQPTTGMLLGIRKEFDKGKSIKVLAAEHGLSRNQTRRIVKYETWRMPQDPPVRKLKRGQEGGRRVLTWPDVDRIRQLAREGVTPNELARKFGVSPARIRDVIRYKGWRRAGDPPVTPPRISRLSPRKIELIRRLYATGGYSQEFLAHVAGVRQRTISRIVNDA